MGDLSCNSVKFANLSDLEVHYHLFLLKKYFNIILSHFLARIPSYRFPREPLVTTLSIRTSFFFYADYLFFSTRYICLWQGLMIYALTLVLLGRLSKQKMELCVDARGCITKIVFMTLYKGVFLGKGKAVLLRAWSGPHGSRKLRFPDYMTTAQDSGKVVSLTHRPP
jgi:hypothetical protein